jgi:CRISPR-associated endonuclease/helicase Cas3
MDQFGIFFQKAMGWRSDSPGRPFPYQEKLALEAWRLTLDVPTGLGKTAAVILAWLWKRGWRDGERVLEPDSETPRRLVYCLPMRVLAEQTRDCARTWLANLRLLAEDAPKVHPPDKVAVHLLMGGDLERDWDRWPDRDQILIGTQDMLLSRALNRGYAMSRFRWPLQFGLLNNDCLWVMDEVQLMGSGLATTAQLQAFRRKAGTVLPVRSLWMSATMRDEWLQTVDFEKDADAPVTLSLSESDRKQARQRLESIKPIEKAGFMASADGKAEAELTIKVHAPGTRTLVVVNTVRRAQQVFIALQEYEPTADLVLLHSRFRQQDRDRALGRLLADPSPNGTLCVSTQVVEAGVDVSARVLITDLAPWSSLVQRFGRCNRKGEFNKTKDARVIWIAPPSFDDEKKLAPYTASELRASEARLAGLTDAGPAGLPAVTEPMTYSHVIRRKDMTELFDTTPDLAGADIDVSRFIRESDEHHVHVFWREVDPKRGPAENAPGPERQELCSAPIADLDLKKRAAWRWDHLEGRWEKPRSLFPGLTLMLAASEGGYLPELGWSPKDKSPVAVFNGQASGSGYDYDRRSEAEAWVSVADHTDAVVNEAEQLLSALNLEEQSWANAFRLAARWHDAGKAHGVFQGAMPEGAPPGVWAKAMGRMKKYNRPAFRHELASALAMLANGQPDLAAYLAAAHHGKVRLSIRSMPQEKAPCDNPAQLFARGIWDGDELPETALGGGTTLPASKLRLSYMALGDDEDTGPSWLARILALRDSPELGPFRLAFLEALLRVADWRASDGKEVR